MTTTYGIVGCGMMGREHIRNIALMDDATVGAILEPNPEMGAAALALAPGAVRSSTVSMRCWHTGRSTAC